nr:uncharacterized protein LOC129442896 [Misgurnus anguillicaudatus]
MFALIKWVEDGKFSILPTEHIREFDEDKYAMHLEEKYVYLVEWRQGKEPKGGWPVYEASIIKIAERERTLQIKLQEIQAKIPKPHNLKRKSKPSMKLLQAAETEMTEEPVAKKKAHLTPDVHDLKVWNEKKIEHLQRVIKELREENMAIRKENERLKNKILEKIPPLLLATEHLLREPIKSSADEIDVPKPSSFNPVSVAPKTPKPSSLKPVSIGPKPVESNDDVTDVLKAPLKTPPSGAAQCSSDADYVELGHGTGIKVLRHQWTSALHAPTATSMVRVLLMAAFPLDVLIHSNLKGGKSKTNNGSDRRSALDKATMAAIYMAVKKRFPNVSNGALGIAVNSKLGELRLLEKKQTYLV